MPFYKNPDFLRPPAGLATIFRKAGGDSFFGLPQWYDAVARFGVAPGTEIRAYATEQPGAMVALLLCRATGERCRSLASLANFYSVEHGIIAAPDADLDRGLASIVAEIKADRPRWDCLQFAEFDPHQPGYAALARALRGCGFFVERVPGAATWYEKTKGVSFFDYLCARPSQLRRIWRRKRRAIAGAGRLSASFVSDAAGLDAAITDYQQVYAASWKPPEPFPHFIPAVIRLAAGLGALRLGLYYLDGEPVAAQFWILWGGRAVIYKLAHDRRLDRLSLGTLLTMEMTERVLGQDRPAEINFGRGDDAFKRLWLPRRRERWGITAANPGTLPGLRFGLEREAAKLYHRLRGERVGPSAASDHLAGDGDFNGAFGG